MWIPGPRLGVWLTRPRTSFSWTPPGGLGTTRILLIPPGARWAGLLPSPITSLSLKTDFLVSYVTNLLNTCVVVPFLVTEKHVGERTPEQAEGTLD